MPKTKRKSKSKNKGRSKRVVHQIFYNIGKGELHEIPRFQECYQKNKKECKKQGIQYKLWSRKMVEKLLEKPKNRRFKKVYYDFDVDIMRIDFARYMILWNFGGIYVDLDICMIGKPIKSLFEKDYFFVRWHNSSLPYNAILGTKPNNPLYLEILEHCEESYYKKKKSVLANLDWVTGSGGIHCTILYIRIAILYVSLVIFNHLTLFIFLKV